MSALAEHPHTDHRSIWPGREIDLAVASRRADVHRHLRTVRVALLGYGRIGQAVATVADLEFRRLESAGVDIQCLAALVRDRAKPRGGPRLDLITTDPDNLLALDVHVAIEVIGGIEPARTLVTRALQAGIAVVSANKTLVAHHGQELAALAAAHGTLFVYDAAVLAGVPFIGSLSRRPLISAARRLEGVINGTSHFITNAIGAGAPFDAALAEATARGYAEPDSSADVGGRDAAEKLTILLHLSGHRHARVADLTTASLEVLAPSDFAEAHRLGGTIKPVAIASLDPAAPGAWVGPAFVAADHPFARLTGVTNALRLVGASGRDVLFAGPGAGPEATAITIIDDVVEVTLQKTAGRSDLGTLGPSDLRTLGPSDLRTLAPSDLRTLGPSDLRTLGPSDLATVSPKLNEPAPGRWFLADSHEPALLTAPRSWREINALVAARVARGHRAIALPVLES